jgi:hypothetical protein
MQQLWRENLLAQSMIDNGLYDEGFLVVIAPGLNHHVQDAAEAYQAQLREPEDGKVRFGNLSTLPVLVQSLGVIWCNIRFADRNEVGLTAMASDVLTDARTGKNGRHALAGLFGSLAKRNLTHAESRHHHRKHAAGPKGGGRRALGL